MSGEKVANWVSERFTISGGDIKLGGIQQGFASFSSAYSSGDRVFYACSDESGNRESGIATYEVGKLTNRQVTSTYLNRTYNDTNPAPLSFSNGGTVAVTLNASEFQALWDAMHDAGDHHVDTDNPHKVTAPQVDLDPLMQLLANDAQHVQGALEYTLDRLFVKVSDDKPQSPVEGDLWADTGATAELYVYLKGQWISMTGAGGAGDGGVTDLTGYIQEPAGDGWMVYRKDVGWKPVTTDLIATNSNIVFRDAKGRFKSSADVPALNNQLEVNRWFLEQLENMDASGGEDYDDTQIKADLAAEAQARTSGDAGLQAQIDGLDLSGGDYDDTQIKADLAAEAQARIDGDTAIDDRIDAIEGNISGGDGIEDAPTDGQLYVRNGGSWEALPPMNDNYTGTNPSLVIRNANGNSNFQWMTAHGMTFTGSKKENKDDKFVLSGGGDGTQNIFRNSIESFRDSMDVYTKAEVDALGVDGGAGFVYYPEEYRFQNMGFGGWSAKEFWALSAENLDPTFEGSGGDPANNLTETVMVKRLKADVVSGPYLKVYATELSVSMNNQDDPGVLTVQGQAYLKNAFSVEHTVLGGINITAADADRPFELPYSADERSIQHALAVTHATLGRTVEIDKEGIIRARGFEDMDGNPIGGGEGGIEEAPADDAWYGRKNEGWVKAPSYTKVQSQRAINNPSCSFRQPRNPGANSKDFELSNGPLTRGVYVEDGVQEAAAVLANWADYDTITFSELEYSLRHTEVGDILEVGDVANAERSGTLLKITSASVEQADGKFSGAFGYELVGIRHADEAVQKNSAYSFHLQKKPDVYSKAEADALFGKFGHTFVYTVDSIGSQAVANRPGMLKIWGDSDKWDWDTISFWPTDTEGSSIPAFEGEFILEIWSFGTPHEGEKHGDWFRCVCEFVGSDLVSYIKMKDYSDENMFEFMEGRTVNVRFYQEGAFGVGRSDLVQSFTELQHAIADEETIEGLKGALHNALGGLIEKFEVDDGGDA